MDKGIPLGSNGGIAAALGTFFGLNVSIQIDAKAPAYNVMTKKWSGILGQVSSVTR